MMRQTVSSFVATMLCVIGWTAVCAEDGAAADDLASVKAVSDRIDAHFDEVWRSAGVEPAPPADDAMFVRRVYLDLTGTIPTVSQVRRFLEDDRPDKHRRLIDQLLQQPNHATHLAHIWRDVMLPRDAARQASGQFENWLQTRFRANTPYDELTREVLTATNSGPILFYSALELKPEELAASTSQVFLGVQIRCAQCHDHPFTEWTQRDFWSLAAFFARIRRPAARFGNELQLTNGVGIADSQSGEVTLPDSSTVVPPQFLDGTKPKSDANRTRRELLADWIASGENEYFARATVNRVWSLLFGVGLVEPVDDLGDHNEPYHPAVLELLAEDFVANQFDTRRLFRVLANTRLYQLSSVTPEGSTDPQLFRSMVVKSLTADQIYQAVVTATARREILQPDVRIETNRRAFLNQFEAPTQSVVDYQAGIPQALTMLNGVVVSQATDPNRSDLLAALIDAPFLTDRDRVETLYLATVSRLPNEDERTKLAAFIQKSRAENQEHQALADILWVLLNSTEFIFNR